MFYQARRLERAYNPLLAILGIAALEVLVYVTSTMDTRLSMMAVGGLVLAFFFLLCLVRLEWGLIALVFLGISTARIPVFTQEFAGVYLSEVLVPLLLVAYLVRVLVRREAPPVEMSALRPLVLLVLVSIASMVHGNLFWDPSVPTNHRYLVVQAVGVVLNILPVATFLLFANCFDVRKNLRWLLPALIVLSSLGALAVLLYFMNLPREYLLWYSTFGWGGLVDFAPLWASPLTAWSGLRILATPLAFAASLYTTNRKMRLALWGLMVPLLVAELVSLKVGMLLGVFAALAAVAWVYSKKLFMALMALLVLLVLVEAVVVEGSTVAKVYANAEQKRSLDRFGIWADGLRIWSTSPALGVGPGNYYSYTYRYSSFLDVIAGNSRVAGQEENPYGNAHNGYVQILGELGIAGLALFLWFLVAALRRVKTAVSGARTLSEKAFTVGGLGAIAGILTQMFSMHGLYYSVSATGYQTFIVGMYLWAMLGMLVALARTSGRGRTA